MSFLSRNDYSYATVRSFTPPFCPISLVLLSSSVGGFYSRFEDTLADSELSWKRKPKVSSNLKVLAKTCSLKRGPGVSPGLSMSRWHEGCAVVVRLLKAWTLNPSPSLMIAAHQWGIWPWKLTLGSAAFFSGPFCPSCPSPTVERNVVVNDFTVFLGFRLTMREKQSSAYFKD